MCAAPRTREGRVDKAENGEFDAKSREIPAEIGKSNESMGTFREFLLRTNSYSYRIGLFFDDDDFSSTTVDK